MRGPREATLGVRLPAQLRCSCLHRDGFRGDRGDAQDRFSWTEPDGIASRVYWDEWPAFFPRLDLWPFVFFGMSGSDSAWAIDWARGDQIIRDDHHLAGTYELAGTDVVEGWRNDYAEYGSMR